MAQSDGSQAPASGDVYHPAAGRAMPAALAPEPCAAVCESPGGAALFSVGENDEHWRRPRLRPHHGPRQTRFLRAVGSIQHSIRQVQHERSGDREQVLFSREQSSECSWHARIGPALALFKSGGEVFVYDIRSN